MRYRQLSVKQDQEDSTVFTIQCSLPDDIDREEKDYTPTPFIWSYPTEIYTYEEAKALFINATIESFRNDIRLAEKAIYNFKRLR